MCDTLKTNPYGTADGQKSFLFTLLFKTILSQMFNSIKLPKKQ